MKKYKFAFGSVQRVQRIAEEQAAMSLAQAQRAADAASAQLQARLADIGAARPAPGAGDQRYLTRQIKVCSYRHAYLLE